MQLTYPSKDEIMNFFKIHSGFFKVTRICDFLIAPRNNVQGEEIQHIKGFLHELKSKDFLLVENEGQDIYLEGFSSTPDRVKKYFTKNEIPDFNNLTTKTDEELREIMRNSIDNSYIPSSVYHKAKQELEFRNAPPNPKDKWWEKTWIQLIMLTGAIAGIIGIYALFK